MGMGFGGSSFNNGFAPFGAMPYGFGSSGTGYGFGGRTGAGRMWP
jgi:hypothetical protein